MRSVLITSITVPPPTVTAAEIRARAGKRTVKSRRLLLLHLPGRRKLAIAGVLVAAAVVCAVVLSVVLPGQAALAFPGPLNLAATSVPAGPSLDELLTTLDISPPEVPAQNDTTFRHYQDWLMETPGPEIISKDIQTWWKPDLSGATVTTDVLQPSGSRLAVLEVSAGGHREEEIFGPGEYNTLVDRPSTDPKILAQQANAQDPLENGPQSILRALASFCTRHQMNPGQRRAMVQVLKTVEGLRYYGKVVDRAGRTGIALGVDNPNYRVAGQTRDILVLDERANILSHETISLVSPRKMQLPDSAVVAYTLFL